MFNRLNEQKLTISVVESITGGSFTSELVKFSGASKVLIAGNTLYTTKAKEEFLEMFSHVNLPDPEQYPRCFAWYVKLFRYYKSRR